MDKFKWSLEQYLAVAQEKEKNRVMMILMRDTSALTGCEKEKAIKEKEEGTKNITSRFCYFILMVLLFIFLGFKC